MAGDAVRRQMARARERGVFIIHSSEDREARHFLGEYFHATGVPAYWCPLPDGKTYPSAPRIS
jgi:hypothetical protein